MAFPKKAERPIRALGNPYAGGNFDLEFRPLFPLPELKGRPVEPVAVLRPSDPQGLGQFPGAICQAARSTFPAPPFVHLRQARQRLQGANQDASRAPLLFGDNVQAFMHAVDEIDVGASRRAEQNACSCGDPARGMRRQIAGPEICLYLNNHSSGTMVEQDTTQEFARHLDRALFIERHFDHSGGFQQGVDRPWVRARFCWPAM
jgi:hypothetical protein